MNKLVSIIIPVHNTEQYVGRAIESVLKQTYSNIELILVDDNSEDNSYDILSLYEKIEERIVLVKNEKNGVSAARNCGIQHSHGEYIVFLDSDDWLDKYIIEKAIKNYKTDSINQWGLIRDGKTAIPIEFSAEREYMISNCIYLLDKRLGDYFRSACGKIFSSELIKKNNICFPEELYMGEDAIFVMKYLKNVHSFNVISPNGYNYFINPNSSTMRYKSDMYNQCKIQLQEINKTIGIEDNNCLQVGISNFKWWMFNLLLDNSFVGVKHGKLSITYFFDDAKKWYDEYSELMLEKNVEDSVVIDLYKKQYLKSNENNFLRMVYYWAFNKIVIKVRQFNGK